MTQQSVNDQLIELPVAHLRKSPWQGRILPFEQAEPRGAQEDVEELRASIEKSGLMQPIVVRSLENGEHEVIDGHRRVLVYKELGRETIPALLKQCSERDAQVLSIVGNLQRKNLKPLELAVAYRKALSGGLFASQRELSVALGKHESFVGEILNTLNMDRRILEDLEKNDTISDIRVLRAIRRAGPIDSDGISEEQYELYRTVVDNSLSRDEVLKMAKKRGKRIIRKPVLVRATKKRMTVEIDLSGLTPENRKKLQSLTEQKLTALLEKLSETDADNQE